jgi:valyl-tRNA synthetase
METGYDIIFFWVARMIMMGLADTGNIPFHTIYLHGLIRDEKGDKMSKVRGNVLNPIAILEKYGTDALRFALSTGTAPGNDIKLASSKLEAGRNFANKLWNATRFIIRSMESDSTDVEIKRNSLPLEDRWILSRLSRTVSSITSLMDDFQFGEAQRQIHDFLWGEFCDWYIEFAKFRLRPAGEIPSPLPVLVYVLETSLRLLHPYMPFVTEELWQNLRRYLPASQQAVESIMVATYPKADTNAVDPQAEQTMESMIEIIRSIRNARAQYKVENTRWIEAQIYAGDLVPFIAPYAEAIQNLVRARPITLLHQRPEGLPGRNTISLVLKGIEVVIPMESMFNVEAEGERRQKEIEQNQAAITRLKARLNDPAFLTKAPATVIDKERQKLSTISDKIERLRHQIPKP